MSIKRSLKKRSSEVDLSNHQAALEMVKPAIHAVERSGMAVHHDLLQQWQSSMQHQRDHGHDKSSR